MELLTIFTPTYNREKKLYETYMSLKNQTCTDFIWLIIDDGSTDNTEKEVRKWAKKSSFKIEYKKKKNGGKHSAYNYALQYIKTEYVYLSLDSDDILYDSKTIELILNELKKLKDEIGLITLCTDSREGKNTFVKKYEIDKLDGKSLSYAYSKNLFKAEGRMILKSEYIKEYKYPEIDKERFFTEAYIYWQMDKKVKWSSIPTCYSNYLSDGLTANTTRLFLKNPNSWYLYNELRAKMTKKKIFKVKYYIYYIAFGIMAKKKIFKKKMNYLYLVLLFPIGLLGSLYLKIKGKKK